MTSQIESPNVRKTPAKSARAVQKLITAEAIEKASARARKAGLDDWLTDPAPRGSGRFTVRCTRAGARICMFRFTLADGSRDLIRIGDFDEQGTRGLTLKAARERAGELSRLYLSGIKDLTAYLAADELRRREQADAVRNLAEVAKARAERGSLQALMDAYCAVLKGRQSHLNVVGLFRLHVSGAFPMLAATPASELTSEQFRDVLWRLVDAGKKRSAVKLRAYLRAAYSVAMRAGLDPSVPDDFIAFGVKLNPLERVPSLSQFNRARDRALTLPELRHFWRRLSALSTTPARDAVVACLLLGGQRPTQLLRVTAKDVDLNARKITIRDGKGRNRHLNPRLHVLPMVDQLMPLIRRRHAACLNADALLFSSDAAIPLREETAGRLVTDICRDMAAAGELEQGKFTFGDLRRTTETQMAELRISKDTRAQVQSHGLGGIQARHYDRHDYMDEKREAIASWVGRLTSTPAEPLTRPALKGGKSSSPANAKPKVVALVATVR